MSAKTHQDDSPSNGRFSRRSLVNKVALGAGMTVLAGSRIPLHRAGAGQIDVKTPPPATPGVLTAVETSPLGPTVASKAAELEFDVEKIFRFVADEVRYEPYSGSLRGAKGTLWSLAGNSVDKSVLLSALLDEALVTHRFATGQLSPEQVDALALIATPTAEEVGSHSGRMFIASTDPRTLGKLGSVEPTVVEDIPLSPEEDAALEADLKVGQQLLAEAHVIAETQVNLIEEALSEAGITIPDMPRGRSTLPSLETRRFAWIQVADGPAWVDYVPVELPGGAPEPAETFEELPEDLQHLVDIKVFAEELSGGTLVRRELVRIFGNASGLANVPVSILVQPPGEFESLGLAFNQAFSGDISLIPYMYAGDLAVVADQPIVFGSNEPGVLGLLGEEESSALGEGETLALWLDIVQTSPDEPEVHIERPLMDRIGAERRLQPLDFQDPETRAAIAPVKLVPFYEGTDTVEELAAVHLLNTDLSRLPVSYAYTDVRSIETYGAATFNIPGMTSFRDTLRLTAELPLAFQTIITRPQFTLTTIALVEPADGAGEQVAELSVDLLRHHPQVAAIDAPPSAQPSHPAILAGVLDQVSEQQLISTIESRAEGSTRNGLTVARVFDFAIQQDVPIVAITNADDLVELDLDPVSISLLERALADGMIAITPTRHVTVEGEPRAGWWLIHPESGHTRDQLDNGKSGASIAYGTGVLGMLMPRNGLHFAETVEYTETGQISRTASKPFRSSLCRGIATALLAASLALSAGTIAGTGEIMQAIKVLSPVAKTLEERNRLKQLSDAARRNGGSGCG